MNTPWRHIKVEARGGLRRVQLRRRRIDEFHLDALTQELLAVGLAEGCTTVILSLGPQPPECLYSVLLGKLFLVQRRLKEQRRELLLCHAGAEVAAIFEACRLTEQFTFIDDFEAAAVS